MSNKYEIFFLIRAVSELAEALRDSDDIKKERNETQKENKDLRERLEAVEKSLRMKSLQRSTGHSHSHDSAIDSDLQVRFDIYTVDNTSMNPNYVCNERLFGGLLFTFNKIFLKNPLLRFVALTFTLLMAHFESKLFNN